MPGTILKDDLQSSIEDQLSNYAHSLTSTLQGAGQQFGDTFADLQRAGRTSAQDIQAQLSDYATQAYNAAQQAEEDKRRQAAEAAAQAAAQTQAVQQHLTDYATQVSQGIAGAAGATVAGAANQVSQFGDQQLSADEAYAACGPAAAVNFAQKYGRNPTLREATDLAAQVGWTQQQGMAGLSSEKALMDKLGVPTRQVGPDVQAMAAEAQTGNPVTISTPGHYFFADGYDPSSGAFHVGRSGTDLRGGSEWMTPDQMQARMGQIQGALFADNPQVPAASTAKQTGGQDVSMPPGPIDASSPQAFARSFAPYARYAADKLGIDPTWVTAMAASESNYGKAPGNELFGVKGSGTAGTQQLATHEGEYGGVQTTGGFAAYQSPMDAVNAWVDLLQNRYKGAVGAQDLPTFIHGLKQGGYFTAAEPEYLGIVQGIKDRISGDVQDALSTAANAIPGVAGARRAVSDVMQAGEAVQAAKPVIYGTLAGAQPDAMQQLGAIQDQLDSLRQQLAGAPEAARRTVQQAAEPIIAGAQDLAGSRLGDLALRSGRTAPEEQAFRQRQQEEVDRLVAEQRNAPSPEITPGSVLGGAARLAIENPPTAGPTLEEYRRQQTATGQAIEQQNPLRDVPFVGGLTSQAAEFGLSGQWLIPFGAVTRTGEEILAAAGVARPLVQRIGGEALSNALQNAIYEVSTRTDATPESVGQAFVSGGVLGGLMPAGSAAVRRIGQEVLARAPGLAPLLRTRQPAQAEVGFAAGVPTRAAPPEDVLHGMAVPRAGYEPGTPEHTVETFLQDQARAQGTPRPQLTGADVAGLPGMEGSRMKGLQEVRDAIEAGVPAARWYQQIVDQIRQDTGQDINPREAAVLMGAFGRNAGVARIAIASRADQARVADALQARGLPVIREQAGTGLRVPLVEGRVAQLARRVQQTLADEALQGKLQSYTGTTHAVESTGQGRARGAGDLRGGAAGRLGVQAGDRLLGHPLAASVFRDAQLPARAGPAVGRARGQANVPFATNLAGAAFGGYAGNLATPEGATPEERARNIAAGAAAGFGGTHLLTRGLLRGAETAPARAAEAFRAPGRPETPELRATTQEPPGGPVRPAGPPPRTLGEVHSNPYALREAAQGETPMSPDEMLRYGDELEQRMSDVQARRDAVDEMLRNPNQKIERPPWAGGLTNLQVAEVARRQGISPYEPLWWEKTGLEAGSGEVREALREGGAFAAGQAQREATPAELRAERARLDTEAQNISTAFDQMTNAPAEPNLVRARPGGEPVAAALPFDTGAPSEPEAASIGEAQGGLDEGARLAQEVVLSKGRGTLRSDEGTVSLTGDVRGTALVSHEAVQRATETPPSARTEANMPNLDAMLGDDMPEIAAQIRKAAEDNPDLFEKYRQGVISQDSLKNDLAKRVGMTLRDWEKTPVGKAFNPEEMVALQAAAIEASGGAQDMGMEVIARGGVDSLTPEELAFSAATLADATKILAVARGGRTTAGRTLNALKNRYDRTMAAGITASNERIAANRLAQQARRAATRATAVLAKGRELEREATTAKAEAVKSGAPRNILEQIDQAYADLDRYNAMTLHEKGAEFDRLKAERVKRAEARKAKVRGAPEELLSALRAELKAEQDNFAKRKDTWETMAFWDSKQFENAMSKRTAFRGQLYIEQQRKLANIAAKGAEKDAARAFDDELKGRAKQTERATRVLEAIGGQEVTKDLLRNYIATLTDPSPDATAKFLKGIAKQSSWGRANIVRIAGLVSAPITHAINVGGNTTMAQVEHLAVRPLTVFYDAMRSGITGGERQAYTAELLPALQASGSGAVGSLPKVLRALRTGINPYEAENLNLARVRPGFNAAALPKVGARAGEVIDAAVEMPLRLLTAEDVMFRESALAYHGQRVAMREAIREGFRGDAAKGRANSIQKNLEDYPELAKEVDDAARREVFQERRNLPLMRGGPSEANMALVESQVLPFVRTPANITAQGLAMSPAGFGGALQAARATRGMPTGTRAERYTRGRQVLLAEERLARATIGTGILAAGVWLGAQGRLTADYPQDEQARSALPQGWRPWSFVVDDPITKNTYYVPLQNLGPVGVPLAMAAIATDPVHHGKSIADPDEWGQAAMGVGRYVLDSTYLQGLSDFVDMLQDPRANASKFAEPLVASYGLYSSLFRELQRTAGVAGRNPREGFRGLLDALLANYPGTSGTVPPARTPLGDERTQGATGLGRLAPFRYDIQRDEPTLKILRDTGVGVPKPPKAIGLRGGSIELTEDEQARLQQMRGQAIRDMVPRVSQNPAAVQKAVDLATASATRAFLAQMGADDVRKRWTAKQAPEPYYLGTAEAAS